MSTPATPTAEIEYPEDDGLPMADNTLQWEWIVTIKHGLEAVFAGDPNVFIAGNLLWYPALPTAAPWRTQASRVWRSWKRWPRYGDCRSSPQPAPVR